jgi:hypothetical protein
MLKFIGKVVRSSDVSSSLAKPDGSELRCFFEVIRCVELRNWQAYERHCLTSWTRLNNLNIRSSDVGVQNAEIYRQSGSLIGCIFQPGEAGWKFIRCVELRDWPAF